MPADTVTIARDAALQAEWSCLDALTRGEDAWPRFMDLFGAFLFGELGRLEIGPGHDRDDLLQELALKLMASDWQIIRRHLDKHRGTTFRAVLRTVIRSIVVDEWRKKKRWRNQLPLDPEPSPAELLDSTWAEDPARALYRETRLICLLWQIIGNFTNVEVFRILYLRFVEGKSVTDIAGEIGVSPNTVSQRIRYYRQRGSSDPG